MSRRYRREWWKRYYEQRRKDQQEARRKAAEHAPDRRAARLLDRAGMTCQRCHTAKLPLVLHRESGAAVCTECLTDLDNRGVERAMREAAGRCMACGRETELVYVGSGIATCRDCAGGLAA
jgi:hypothetical protein